MQVQKEPDSEELPDELPPEIEDMVRHVRCAPASRLNADGSNCTEEVLLSEPVVPGAETATQKCNI
jgi:hypothetical protein